MIPSYPSIVKLQNRKAKSVHSCPTIPNSSVKHPKIDPPRKEEVFQESRSAKMGEAKQIICESINLKKEESGDLPRQRQVKWDLIQDSEDSGSSNSMGSSCCLSDSDLEDASSSSSSTISPPSPRGPLFELSELMNQLPIKRGLSKHYQGKSQSFSSLAHVGSLEDLAKKGSPFSGISSYQRMKSCKSYAGFDGHHHKYGPKATITKKSSRGSFLSSLSTRGNFVG